MDDDFFLQPTKSKFHSLENEVGDDVILSPGLNSDINNHSFNIDGVQAVQEPLLTPLKSPYLKVYKDRENNRAVGHPKEKKDTSKSEKSIDQINIEQPLLKIVCDSRVDSSQKGEESKDSTVNIGDKIFRTLKFLVKKGRVFEIRKLSRRIQLLKKKKGNEKEKNKNERKVTKLLATIEVLKNLSISIACNKLSAFLQDIFEKIRLDVSSAPVLTNWLEILKNSFSCVDDLELVYCLRILHLKNVSARFNGEIKEHCQEFLDTKVSEERENLSSTSNHQSKDKDCSSIRPYKHSVDLNKTERRPEVDEANHKLKVVKIRKDVTQRINGKAKFMPDRSTSHKRAKISKKNSHSAEINDEKLQRFKEKLQRSKSKYGNRLGQRARRELWEKMYGKDAVHVKKGIKSRPKKIEKQYNPSQGPANDKRSSHNKMGYQGKTETTESSLHPSWQARKQQKVQNQIVQFQGVKIKFDD